MPAPKFELILTRSNHAAVGVITAEIIYFNPNHPEAARIMAAKGMSTGIDAAVDLAVRHMLGEGYGEDVTAVGVRGPDGVVRVPEHPQTLVQLARECFPAVVRAPRASRTPRTVSIEMTVEQLRLVQRALQTTHDFARSAGRTSLFTPTDVSELKTLADVAQDTINEADEPGVHSWDY